MRGTEAAVRDGKASPARRQAVLTNRVYGGRKPMKLITAVVRPHRLADVRTAVARMGLEGLTVTEQQEHGAGRPRTEVYRGSEYRVDWRPRLRIEIVVEDDLAEQVTEAICNIARTGRQGDGTVFVSSLAEAIRIRTGESGGAAL